MSMGFRYAWRATKQPINVEQYRQAARRALPDMAWSYVEGGADDEETKGLNREAFSRWRLRQRVLTGEARPSLKTEVANTAIDLPVILAPTGLTGFVNWRGDVAVARAAEAAGTRLILSTAASYSLKEVSTATQHAPWFQLYPFGNREFVSSLLSNAKDAGYEALFVTVDVPVRGNREAERTHGVTSPPTITARGVVQGALHPRWTWNLLRHRRIAAANYVSAGFGRGAQVVKSLEAQDRFMQADLCWEDLAWIRSQWRGPLFVKGILDPEDAAKAIDQIGADGIVVSNHGGRQLDGAMGTLDALPNIVRSVGGRTQILLDGGVRRGSDIVKALSLGASAVLIGRPYLYGLAVAGETGVRHVLQILEEEIQRTLTLMGCPSVQALNPSWLIPGPLPNKSYVIQLQDSAVAEFG